MATKKKIEVDLDFVKSVAACGSTIYVDDVDAAAYSAFMQLKKNKIKPYCKFASYDDYKENNEE
jgi:hypothetical protein